MCRPILFEALGQLTLAQVAVHLIPSRSLMGGLGQEQSESPLTLPASELGQAQQVKWAISAIVRRLPRPPKCLVQAVAAQWMLRRRHIASTLYLGVARDAAKDLHAHAWVRCATLLVTGAVEHQRFTVVGRFASLPAKSRQD